MNCTYHPRSPISLICVAPHKCQRKLCVECQHQHGGDLKQFIPMQFFCEQLYKKSEDFKLNTKNPNSQQQRIAFKQLLRQSEMILKKTWEDLSQSIQGIYDMIEQQDQIYLSQMNPQNCPSESSYTDLEIMVEILEGNILKNWTSIKKNYLDQLNQIHHCFSLEIDQFIKSINQQFSGIFWKEKIQEYDGLLQKNGQLKTTKFEVHFTKTRELHYHLNGQILQIVKQYDLLTIPQIITNLEQIKYLKWIGEVGKDFKKIGLWQGKWKSENLKDCVGMYSLDGKKQGKWKEMIKNFYDNAQAYEVGEYVNGKRKGSWKYIYENREFVGGEYSLEGHKIGKWVELWDRFWDKSQLSCSGGYKNGKKVGRWDIWLRLREQKEKIGGGSYDETGNELKLGNWVEISDKFDSWSQVKYVGGYINSKKVGQWETQYKFDSNEQYSEIGGGSYDYEGNEFKIGNWIDLDEGFLDYKQVIHSGIYQNGKKVDRWVTKYKFDSNEQYSEIGGGSYDYEGNEFKIGNWIDLDEGFLDYKQLIHLGQYNNCKKVGRWNIEFRFDRQQPFSLIAGGSYDQEGNEFKIGNWIDLDQGFNNTKQVRYHGEYQNGKKVGRWLTKCKFDNNEQFSEIAGGSYDYEGNEFKIGKWIDLDQGFNIQKQVSYYGEYKNGKKVGIWDTWHVSKDQNQKINNIIWKISGGGSYDETGNELKLGNWVEISDNFNSYFQVINNGEYINGKKVGLWVETQPCISFLGQRFKKKIEIRYDN